MNLNHLEAIAVTQKLAYSLEERDFDAVDVVVLPPFTDIRSVQTLVDGDRLKLAYGAQDISPEKVGSFHWRYCWIHVEETRLLLCCRRAL